MAIPLKGKEKSKRSFETVVKHIKNLIENGELNPGDRLRSERDMAEILKVSRPSVREAFRTLEKLGILEVIPTHGTFIKKPDISILSEYLGLLFALKKGALEEFTSVRIVLECEGARQASLRALPEDLIAIEEVIKKMRQSGFDYEKGVQSDYEFHYLVIAASHNGVLLFLYKAVSDMLWKMHRKRRIKRYKIPGALDFYIKIHKDIYESIKNRDSEQAVSKMKNHLFLFSEKFGDQEDLSLFDKRLII